MRVLLTTNGSRGDIEPTLALATRLRDHGADVLLAAPPDPEFLRRINDVGIASVLVGEPVRPMVTGGRLKVEDLPARAAALIADQFAALIPAADGRDVVVAVSPKQFAARSAAEAAGSRYVYVSLQPTTLPTPDHAPMALGGPFPSRVTDNRILWAMSAQRYDAVFGPPLDEHRAAVGLPPVTGVFDHMITERPWLATDPILSPWSESAGLDVVQTGAWTLRDDRPLADDVRAFLDAGSAPVHVGFGSMPMAGVDDLSRTVVEACRANGRRVVLGRGWAGLDRIDDRDDHLVVDEINHQALFARSVAVVHHGGAGTTTAAAVAGVPQVIVPQLADQPYFARRVTDLGIGTGVDGPVPTRESLTEALAAVLDTGVRARAAEVASAVRPDGAGTAAAALMRGD